MRNAANVTLRDVAVVAGVSVATASKALRGDPRISEPTRKRVRDTAARLDYTPNALAQSFASGQSRTVGVFTHRAQSPFSRPVVIGALDELGARDRAALMFDADVRAGRWRDDDIRTLRARKVEGVLVVGTSNDQPTRSLTDRFASPVVYAFTDSDDPDDPVFQIDSVTAGRLATEHLISLGRRRIAHITAAADSLSVRGRERGMMQALDAAGSAFRPPILYGSWSQAWGAEAAERLLAEDGRIDAIFCGNDQIAFGVLDTLTARGLRVPDDVALVGVDNWEGSMLDVDTRRLTSVDLRLGELGAAAARFLVAGDEGDTVVLDDSPTERRRTVAPLLVTGTSTTG